MSRPVYTLDEVHPTARCLECEGRLVFALNGRLFYWLCEHYADGCRFTTPTAGKMNSAKRRRPRFRRRTAGGNRASQAHSR